MPDVARARDGDGPACAVKVHVGVLARDGWQVGAGERLARDVLAHGHIVLLLEKFAHPPFASRDIQKSGLTTRRILHIFATVGTRFSSAMEGVYQKHEGLET